MPGIISSQRAKPSGFLLSGLYAMTTPPFIREIPLARVDLDAHPFKIAQSEDLSRLQESLTAVGLLSFPRVQSLENGWWRPITGWKRLKAAAQLGWRKIPALILGPQTPEARLLLLYLQTMPSPGLSIPWSRPCWPPGCLAILTGKP